MNKLKLRIRLILPLVIAILTGGCSTTGRTPVVTINDKTLYIEDFLYDIHIIETEGNRLEQYYLDTLGYSYWDFEYEGSTMRETAKSSVLTRVVMYTILADQANQSGIKLTEKDVDSNNRSIEQLYETTTEAALNSVGLTREVLNKAYSNITLGDKYYLELAKNFNIDEKSVQEAITTEENEQFAVIYRGIKEQYDIDINFDYWDTITLGSITIPKE